MNSTKSTTVTSREYAWPRFWVRLGGSIDLSDGGYLVDSTSEIAKYGGRDLPTLPELVNFRALALLGEPGMGKSAALRSEAYRLKNDENFTSIFVDLRAY
ncbi:MAG TPA: hypothetical protein VHX61_18320, partial [Rhizomicrobium sp.]|nr:hypothetical protein [Rhizomicrobium sp.]